MPAQCPGRGRLTAVPRARSFPPRSPPRNARNHAQGDHQEGDALVKQMTGAQVMAMAEDVAELQAMKPGGKEHPIDKVLHDASR
jgi:hypothetical protein